MLDSARHVSRRSLPPQQAELPGSRSRLSGLRQLHGSRPPHGVDALGRLQPDARIVFGTAGDNLAVLQLLVQTVQAPLAEDFFSRLDAPTYDPADRLLIVGKKKLVGHVQLSRQRGWFAHQRCPLVLLHDLVVLPEYRPAQFDAALLEAAESVAVRQGAVLGVIRTDRVAWFEQQGWSVFRGQGSTRAGTHAILAHLNKQRPKRRSKQPSLEIRTWRHVELDALRRIYNETVTPTWGPIHRTESTWRWLVGRNAQDQILLAMARDSGKRRNDATDANVVGYAVVRDACIVEMHSLSDCTTARAQLVAQACRDAIDHNHHCVSLHTSADDPMHELLVTAGGSWIDHPAATGGKWMFKLLAPDRWIQGMYPLLHQRAREAGLTRPMRFDLESDRACHRLTLTKRSARLEPINRAKLNTLQQPVCCRRSTLQNLLCCNLAVPEAVDQGLFQATRSETIDELAALFQPLLFWQSPFEQLRL